MPKLILARPISFVFGVGCAALGCWGAYTYQLKLEKEISYLVVAAPVVCVGFACALSLAKWSWKQGDIGTALGWLLFTIPAAWFLFGANAERIHFGKEGQTADLRARQFAAVRARNALAESKAKLTPQVTREEADAKARQNCVNIPSCNKFLVRAAEIRAEISAAETTLNEREKVELGQSPWSPPIWLLPVLVEAMAVLGVLVGTGGPWVVKTPTSFAVKRKAFRSMVQEIEERAKQKLAGTVKSGVGSASKPN